MATTTVAVVNQKGGVAKTTTAVHIASGLVEQGARVVLIDLDPQASLTFHIGLDPDAVDEGIHEAMMSGDVGARLVRVVDTGDGGVCDVIPANVELAGTEAALITSAADRYLALRRVVDHLRGRYDAVIIDCSPTLGLLTLNALAAADEVIVPVTCDMLSHRGVGQLLDTVADVRESINPKVTVRGIVPTMFDARLSHARAILADLSQRFDVPVFAPIPRSVKFAEAPAMGVSVLTSASKSPGAQAYRKLARELASQWGITQVGQRRRR